MPLWLPYRYVPAVAYNFVVERKIVAVRYGAMIMPRKNIHVLHDIFACSPLLHVAANRAVLNVKDGDE